MSTETNTLGLRERKKIEAKKSLINAALELFAERGFEHVTVDDIASKANVSRRTFFRYFATKEAVVLDRRMSQLDEIKSLIAIASPKQPIDKLVSAAVSHIVADYEANRRRILSERALFRQASSLLVADIELDRLYEEEITKALSSRASEPGSQNTAARLFAATLMASLRVAIDEWAASKGKLSLETLAMQAVPTLLQLLARNDPPAAKTTRLFVERTKTKK